MQGRVDFSKTCWSDTLSAFPPNFSQQFLYFLSDPPLVSVDKLYLSQQDGLSLELVCSAQANPAASLTWSRLEVSSGQWREVRERTGEDTEDDTGVWTVYREVSLGTSFSAGRNAKYFADGDHGCTFIQRRFII